MTTTPKNHLSERFDDALAFASRIHRDQRRKGAKIPYMSYLERRIDSYVKPKGFLTKPGMSNNESSHESEWRGIEKVMKGQTG